MKGKFQKYEDMEFPNHYGFGQSFEAIQKAKQFIDGEKIINPSNPQIYYAISQLNIMENPTKKI
jgi:hypothetical protein